MAPLLEAHLDLQAPNMVFSPSLELGAPDSLFEIVENLINDVFKMSSLVPRLAQHSPSAHYQVKHVWCSLNKNTHASLEFLLLFFCQADMESMTELADTRHLLMERVKAAMTVCCNFRSSLERFSYLYMDDRKEFMRQFLEYGQNPASPDVEVFYDSGIYESTPTLDSFRGQIDR